MYTKLLDAFEPAPSTLHVYENPMASTAREVAFASKPQPLDKGADGQPGQPGIASNANVNHYPEFVVAGSTHQEATAGNLYNQLHAQDDDANNDVLDTRDEDFAYLEAISERERAIQASQEDQVQKFLSKQQEQQQNANRAGDLGGAFVHEKALEALSTSKSSSAPPKRRGISLKFAKVAKVSKVSKITKTPKASKVHAKKRSRFSQDTDRDSGDKFKKPAAGKGENELAQHETRSHE